MMARKDRDLRTPVNQQHSRPARKEDCPTIAALYSMSSSGVADYIWSKNAKPGETILTVGRRRYEREESSFSYNNCIVIEYQAFS